MVIWGMVYGINHTFNEVNWLVGGLEPWNFMTFHERLGILSSQLTTSYFSEGYVYHQPVVNQQIVG